jgi:hypothetical protein
VKIPRRLSALIDGVLYDTHNRSRDGGRHLYRFFSLKP